MDLTNFFIERDYIIESSTKTPKGRGKIQLFYIIDRKPTEKDIKDCEKKFNIKVIKIIFKKGKELTLLIRPNEEDEINIVEDVEQLSINTMVDLIFDKKLNREELINLLSRFQSQSYTNGFNTHKKAMSKLLEIPLDTKEEEIKDN